MNWKRILPGVAALRDYRPAYFRYDAVAGISLAALVAPAGMAYAELAGLPPITGLYASLASLLVYALLGPSRAVILGPDSSTAPLVAATVVPLSIGAMQHRIALAGMLAILVGALAMLVGIFRLGFVADLLSRPVRVGYMNGIALVVFVSQLPKFFGVPVSADKFVDKVSQLAQGLDSINWISFALGVTALAIIIVTRQLKPEIPGLLIAVVVTTLATAVLGLTSRGVLTVGTLPQGLPVPTVPSVSLNDIELLLTGAVGVTVMTLADSTVLSRSLSARFGYEAETDDEFRAIGAANVAAGFVQGFPVSASATRSSVAASAGAKTQACSLVAAVILGGLLFAAPGLTANLPQSVLAAIVIVAAMSLADVRGFVRLFGWRKTEFGLAAICFLGVVLWGVLPGVFIAIALSLLNFVRRQWRPHDAVLGRAPGIKGYHDTGDVTDAKEIPGLLIYRFDAPLFFANAEGFRDRILELVDSRHGQVRRVLVAAEPITDVDTSAVEPLCRLIGDLKKRGVELRLAEVKHPVLERMRSYGILDALGDDAIYPTVGSGVHDYVHSSGVDWVDWEDADEHRTAESASKHSDARSNGTSEQG